MRLLGLFIRLPLRWKRLIRQCLYDLSTSTDAWIPISEIDDLMEAGQLDEAERLLLSAYREWGNDPLLVQYEWEISINRSIGRVEA